MCELNQLIYLGFYLVGLEVKLLLTTTSKFKMLFNKRTKHVVSLFSESGRPPPDISPDMTVAEPVPTPLHVACRSSGIDELNLAEFPLTHLGSRSEHSLTTLEFSDQVFDERSHQPVQRSLLVTGSPLYGLPGPTDADVLFHHHLMA